jgi:hypothetical protein
MISATPQNGNFLMTQPFTTLLCLGLLLGSPLAGSEEVAENSWSVGVGDFAAGVTPRSQARYR